MRFQKGNPGKPKGTKNNPDAASLKTLLEDAFLRNRSAAIAKIDAMFQGSDLKDFKWLCEVKASIEPRQLEHSGSINLTAKTILSSVDDASNQPNRLLNHA